MVMGPGTRPKRSLPAAIRREIEFQAPLAVGSRGQDVKRVQEWLNLHGYGLTIDSDFGSITKRQVSMFQEANGLGVTGAVNARTRSELVRPMSEVLTPLRPASTGLAAMVLKYARRHLAQHPREVGGQNRGPWVRLYMLGHDGAEYPWCAGFVTFVLKQASETLGRAMPIKGSFSCDTLAAQAKEAGLFVKENDVGTIGNGAPGLGKASIFLVRRTGTDWTHTGLAFGLRDDSFDTIEGNTNDDGSREGYEVCARVRGYGKKDFISLATA